MPTHKKPHHSERATMTQVNAEVISANKDVLQAFPDRLEPSDPPTFSETQVQGTVADSQIEVGAPHYGLAEGPSFVRMRRL